MLQSKKRGHFPKKGKRDTINCSIIKEDPFGIAIGCFPYVFYVGSIEYQRKSFSRSTVWGTQAFGTRMPDVGEVPVGGRGDHRGGVMEVADDFYA